MTAKRHCIQALLFVLASFASTTHGAPAADPITSPGKSTLPQAGADSEAITPVDWAELAFTIKDDRQFEVSQLPDRIRSLQGRRVQLRGYFHLGVSSRQPAEFVLLGEVKQPRTAKPRRAIDELPADQVALVEMAPGKVASVTRKPVAVTGRLEIEVLKVDGKVVLVFRVIADSVKEVLPRSGYGPALGHGC